MSPTTGYGGAEGYMLTLGRAAVSAGWEVTISVKHGAGTSNLVDLVRAHARLAYCDARLADAARRGAVVRQTLATSRLLLRTRPTAAVVVPPWPSRGLGNMLGAALTRTPTLVVFQLAS